MRHGRKHDAVMKEHPEIAAWLKDRPENTKRLYSEKLMSFCGSIGMTPEEWRRLDKFAARDLAWNYVEPLKGKQSAKAALTMDALKSWFRNLNGEKLPLDSARGGKHAIHIVHKKATYEHIPNKEESYRIIDMAGNLRDRAMLLTLFQSGVRVNALCRLMYGMVSDQLDQDIIPLKITSDIDEKLKGADIAFYYTCVNGEAVVTLRQFCKVFHKNSKSDTPLFFTKNTRSPVNQTWVLAVVKKCLVRAGFDKKTMWTHSFRKAFRKVVRQAQDLDDDDREALMGHRIRGSRESYYDRHDVELIKKIYGKCNFSREVPQSETTKLRKQLEDEQTKRAVNELRVEKLEKELESMRGMIKEMLEKQA